ncbi:MAG: hypothetical protein Q8L34_05990 [Candidatus Woesearchaeota archaeon]|nr:hypothetical protein [Candidatus Woesearchaeota archaeon]
MAWAQPPSPELEGTNFLFDQYISLFIAIEEGNIALLGALERIVGKLRLRKDEDIVHQGLTLLTNSMNDACGVQDYLAAAFYRDMIAHYGRYILS